MAAQKGTPDNLSLEQAVEARLKQEWKLVEESSSSDESFSTIPEEIRKAIGRSINTPTKTYRYVLPTQLLAKLVDPQLDCRSVQKGSGLHEPFDARTICHGPIVRFDRGNNDVLGGSGEPYASNPLRIPALLKSSRTAQKNKAGFDDLRQVLDYAQLHPSELPALVKIMLWEIKSRLEAVRVAYPVPNRASLAQVSEAVGTFLQEKSGGLRLQTVAVALFQTIGKNFGLFDDVRSAKINAADASTGLAADLECVDKNGEIIIGVEVKDRQLTLRQVQDKLPSAREKGIQELIFLIQGGVESADQAQITALISKEFGTGQNLYVIDFDAFFRSCLTLLGEKGRRQFLKAIGDDLELKRADLSHRKRWARLLEQI